MIIRRKTWKAENCTDFLSLRLLLKKLVTSVRTLSFTFVLYPSSRASLSRETSPRFQVVFKLKFATPFPGMNIFVAFFLLLLLLADSTPSASTSVPYIGESCSKVGNAQLSIEEFENRLFIASCHLRMLRGEMSTLHFFSWGVLQGSGRDVKVIENAKRWASKILKN